MSELMSEVEEVFREVFDDDELVVTRSTSAKDIEDWDSLMHISLIVAIEQRFGIQFATAEISALKEEHKNLGDFVDLIDEKRRRAE